MGKAKERRDSALNLFLKRFDGEPPLPLSYFHTFLCPVAVAEAMVKEHIVEDYGALELLVLRLYDAGFHRVEQLASLSGMKNAAAMIERALNNEIMVYNHISMEDGKLTEMGRKTLQENEAGNRVSHAMYDTPRKMQIEAATGTVIPGYLEDKTNFMEVVLKDQVDGIAPRESVEQDEELRREINERLLEYKHIDILNEGDTIVSVESLRTTQVYYRWAYLAQFEGMKYPMIVMRGYKSIDNVNAESVKKGSYGEHVAVPLALSETDAKYLKQHGMEYPDVLTRKDSVFEYLLEKSSGFDLHYEDEDILLEEEEEIFEDERTLETETEEKGEAKHDGSDSP